MIRENRIYRHVLLLVLFTVLAAQTADTAENPGESPFNIVSLRENTVPYVSMVDLAEKYSIHLEYNPSTLKLTARSGSDVITVLNHSETATYNGAPVNLVFPAQLIQGAMFVPVTTFLPVFSNLLAGEITWDDRQKRIDTSGIRNTLTDIRFESREGGMLVGIGITESLECTDRLSDDRWLSLSFRGGTYDPEELFGDLASRPNDFIEEIRHTYNDGEAVISFKVSEQVGTYSITRNETPREFLLSLRYKRDDQTDLVPDASLSFPPSTVINTDLVVIDTVIIDPGHGGRDPGAIGPGGTHEKDIVLAVAKELKSLIDERREIKAVLTRDRDVYVSLQDRARIASTNEGKLFISIHANGLENRRMNGMEVYFLSDAKTESAKLVAERENAVVRFEENPGYYSGDLGILSKIQFDMLSNVYIEESQFLCQLMLEKGISATKQTSRGVKQGPFYVLLGTQALMPSILFEIGYISNANEETMMKRVSYQKRIAEAMYDAIIEFKRLAERDLAERDQ